MNLRKSMPESISDEQVKDMENEIVKEISMQDAPFIRGRKYLVRTVTMINVGKVKKVTKNFVTLTTASWIADTGVFSECLKKPDAFSEVEHFFKDVHINIRSIVDFTEWPFQLPALKKEN